MVTFIILLQAEAYFLRRGIPRPVLASFYQPCCLVSTYHIILDSGSSHPRMLSTNWGTEIFVSSLFFTYIALSPSYEYLWNPGLSKLVITHHRLKGQSGQDKPWRAALLRHIDREQFEGIHIQDDLTREQEKWSTFTEKKRHAGNVRTVKIWNNLLKKRHLRTLM